MGGAALQQLQRPEAADDLLALADQAQLVQGEADVLREGLRAARRQLATLQRQLLSLHRQALRQQSVLGTLLVEQVGTGQGMLLRARAWSLPLAAGRVHPLPLGRRSLPCLRRSPGANDQTATVKPCADFAINA